MLVDRGLAAVGSMVTGAIREASQATGASFSYLLATAQVESGLNPRAGAATSSARGLFQFVEQTWLGTMKQSGAALGYGHYADAITKAPSGLYEVKDPAMRSQILKLRNDPTANAVMAGAFTQANAAYLTRTLGRPPTEGELYIAHFLGAGGAGRLIALGASNPNAKAADFFAHAAQANPSIFYDRSTGAARTIAQVRDVLTGRYDLARAEPQTPAPGPAPSAALQVANAAPTAAAPLPLVPDTAGIANAFAAAVPAPSRQDGQMFHGLFQNAPRTGPVGSVVSRLWSTPDSSTVAPGASAPPPQAAAAGGSILDLFSDLVRGS